MDRNDIKNILKFEFDKGKSAANINKHGIDFNQAQTLWKDRYLLEYEVVTNNEPRSICIGKIAGKHWVAVVTYRQTRIRLISVRRARRNEMILYEISRHEQETQSNAPLC